MRTYDFDQYVSTIADNGDRIVDALDGSYHFRFKKSSGYTMKWGRTQKDDPTHCPWGNEIADIEITTSCSGIHDKNGKRQPCDFCYKSNCATGTYMDFDTFKKVFDKMNAPKTMTQIAFGVDAQCKTNPDVWKIMDYCLENNVTPNITVADIDEETAMNIVSRCGACAVSAYERNKDCCYDSIKLLTDEAKRQSKEYFQVNMHLLVSHETESFVFEVLNDVLHDERLMGMGAVVLLSLKQKGRGKAFGKMDDEIYQKVIDFLQDNKISYGSDSCGANRLATCLKNYYKPEKYFDEAMMRHCHGGKCHVATLGKRTPLGWSAFTSNAERVVEYLSLVHKLNDDDNKKYVGYSDAILIDKDKIVFSIGCDFEKAKHFVIPLLTTNNDKLSYGYFSYELCDVKNVDEEYIKPFFGKLATEEAGYRFSNALSCIEPCESTKFSIFVNVKGEVFPCSFVEKEPGWELGIDLKSDRYVNFTTQVWNHPRILEWRSSSYLCTDCENRCKCPHYEI